MEGLIYDHLETFYTHNECVWNGHLNIFFDLLTFLFFTMSISIGTIKFSWTSFWFSWCIFGIFEDFACARRYTIS